MHPHHYVCLRAADVRLREVEVFFAGLIYRVSQTQLLHAWQNGSAFPYPQYQSQSRCKSAMPLHLEWQLFIQNNVGMEHKHLNLMRQGPCKLSCGSANRVAFTLCCLYRSERSGIQFFQPVLHCISVSGFPIKWLRSSKTRKALIHSCITFSYRR